MIFEEKTTVPISPAATDGEQSCTMIANPSIAENPADVNPPDGNSDELERYMREMRLQMLPGYIRTVTMNDLFDVSYPARPPVIDGLLYSGTYIFAGAPKVGKSFFMAQLAYHISTGRDLWDYPVRRGTVLYLALEDDYHRLQERLYRMFGMEGAENLFFSVEAKSIKDGLDEQLRTFLHDHPDTRLIIIDTLQKVRASGSDGYSYAADYEVINTMKQLADANGICILLVHHTRKAPSGDRFEMISGTTGLLGAADGAFLLQKDKRTDDEAIMDITGRDQPDQRLHLRRDPERLTWELESAETEIWKAPPDPILGTIAERLKSSPVWEGTSTELAGLIGTDLKPNQLSRHLNVNAGRLEDEYGIRYETSRTGERRTIRLTVQQSAV